jgi:hypothetical protein
VICLVVKPSGVVIRRMRRVRVTKPSASGLAIAVTTDCLQHMACARPICNQAASAAFISLGHRAASLGLHGRLQRSRNGAFEPAPHRQIEASSCLASAMSASPLASLIFSFVRPRLQKAKAWFGFNRMASLKSSIARSVSSLGV